MRRLALLAGALVALVPLLGLVPAGAAGDPPFSVSVATLDAALDCTPFTSPEREPVLLVHGTGSWGHEQWDWSYLPFLQSRGFDVCIVDLPDRGLGDIQVATEYVARAIQVIAASSGRKVDVVGHSQGALEPRWAVKWWPSVRASVDDLVMLAGPNHGTYRSAAGFPPLLPASFWQMTVGSKFITALNAGDETPGDISYTALYSTQDLLVQPATPVPTAAVDWGLETTAVQNVAIQDVCPERFVDHLAIGTTDRVTQELVVDALVNSGAVDVARAGGAALCALGYYMTPAQLPAALALLPLELTRGFPNLHIGAEPALKAYAT